MLEICEKIGKILSDFFFCVGFTNHGKNDHEKVDNHDKFLLPPQGFRPEAKSQGGTLVTRAYIKDSTYSSNIQSVY